VLEIVVILVGWMTDVGSVDPAFKPRSLAIDRFMDLQIYSTLNAGYMSLLSTVTQSMLQRQLCRSGPIQTGYAFNC
jgi:hypothetical protein